MILEIVRQLHIQFIFWGKLKQKHTHKYNKMNKQEGMKKATQKNRLQIDAYFIFKTQYLINSDFCIASYVFCIDWSSNQYIYFFILISVPIGINIYMFEWEEGIFGVLQIEYLWARFGHTIHTLYKNISKSIEHFARRQFIVFVLHFSLLSHLSLVFLCFANFHWSFQIFCSKHITHNTQMPKQRLANLAQHTTQLSIKLFHT